MDVDARRFAAATARNRAPILAVLERVLPARGLVLEIASGTGEHAAAFAERLPGLFFQPSDADPGALASIDAWRRYSGLANLRPALRLDVHAQPWPLPDGAPDAILCINLIHIAPWSACLALLDGAAALLAPAAPLVLYGPYRERGVHTAPSNAAFDVDLRERDARWGVRDLDEVAAEADARGLDLCEVVVMPANNRTVVLRRRLKGVTTRADRASSGRWATTSSSAEPPSDRLLTKTAPPDGDRRGSGASAEIRVVAADHAPR